MSEQATLGDDIRPDDEKDLTFGDFPDDWRGTPLGDTSVFNTTSAGLESFSGSKIYVPTGGVEGRRIVETDGEITYEDRPSRANLEIKKGDVLFAKMKDSIKVLQGTDNTSDDYVFSTGFIRVRPESGINPEFLTQIFLSDKFNQRKDSLAIGSTQPAIGLGDLSGLTVPVPPLEEQRKIASVLYTVDQAIQETEEIIEQINRLKLGVSQHYFMAYNTIRREENPDSIEMVELDNLAEFKPGKAWKTKNLSEDGMRVVRIGNLTGEIDDYWQYNGDYEERRVIEDGDLLFSWAGMKSSIGVHIYQGKKALLNQHIYNLVPTSSIGRKFLYYYLDYRMSDLYSLSQGGAVQIHLTKDIIERILVPKLDSDRRDSIVNHLEEIDCTLQNEISYRNQLRRLKRGLMQDLLSGEVRTHEKDIPVIEEVLAHG